MKTLLDKLVHLGIESDTPHELVDEVKVINSIKIQGAIMVALSGIVTMLLLPQHALFVFGITLVHVLSAFFVLAFNAFKGYEFAKWIFVLDPALLVLALTIYFGVACNLHYIALISFMMFVYLFRSAKASEPFLLLTYIVLTVFGVTVAYIFDLQLGHPSASVIEVMRVVAFTLSVALAIMMGVVLSKSSRTRLEQNKVTFEASKKDAVILQSISDTLEEAIFKSSVEEGFVFVNEAFVKMFGYEDKEDISKTHPVNLYNSKLERESLLARIYTDGKVINELMQYRRKDGSNFWGRLNCQLLKEDENEMLIGTIVDVTGQQEQTELLKTSERRLKEAQRLAKLGNWRMNPLKGTVNWSAESAHIHGFLPSDYANPFEEWIDRVEGISFGELQLQIDRFDAMNQEYEFGAWYTTPSGESKYLNYICRVERDGSEAIWYGTVQDNTVLKNQELELISTREFYQNILDAIPVETILIDEEYTYYYISKNAISDETLRAWLIGKTNLDYVKYRALPDDFGIYRDDRLREAFSTGLTVRWEEKMKTLDGRDSYHLRNIVPITLSYGRTTKKFLIGYSFDINDIKIAQFRLEQKNNELTQLNRELDRFVYSISHDLRAPIASVLGLTSLAEECDDSEELQGILDMQREALDRLDQYIRDVIDYARNKRMDITKEHINLYEFVNSCLTGLDYMANFNRLSFFVEVDKDCSIFTDKVRMQIILSNLFSNAIKYSDPNKEKSFLSVRAKVENDTLYLEVEDNGLGIEEEFQDQIWDIFFRGNSDVPGSGLGLYILKESVKNLNGTVTLKSKLSEGTTFKIIIPVS